jgi:hypothetical protein
MTELSGRTRALLEITRGSDGPSEEDRGRLARSIAAKAGVAVPILLGGASVGALPHAGATAAAEVAVGGAASSSGLGATLLSSAGVKIFLAGLVGASVGLATMAPIAMLTPRAGEVESPQPREPTPASDRMAASAAGNGDKRELVSAVAPAHTSPQAAAEPNGDSLPRQSARRRSAEPGESTAGSAAAVPTDRAPQVRSKTPASLTREAELLAAVQDELRANKAGRALELLDEHESAYSGGALSQERQALRVLVLCQTGQREAARHLAVEFLTAAPRSPLVPRVRSSCAFAAQDSTPETPAPAQRSPARK